MVRHFHVLHFHAAWFWWSVIFTSCIFSRPNHWYTFDGVSLHRLAAMTVRGKEKVQRWNIKSDQLSSFGLKNTTTPAVDLLGTRALIQHRPLPSWIWSGSGVRMTSKICNADSLAQSYICGKIFIKIQSVWPDIWGKLWKMPYLTMLKDP